MLLRIESPTFVAGAVWANESGEWRCERVAPILWYMRVQTPEAVKAWLKHKKWRYTWTKIE